MKNFERTELLKKLRSKSEQVFDVVVIGGGATGVGCAWAAVSKGYKVLLIEKYDFGKGTSSRSTKLIHGGVRYLAQGNFKLVIESLKERKFLLQSFPHLVKLKRFLIPSYQMGESSYYRMGLWIYDSLAKIPGKWRSNILNRKDSLTKFSNLKRKNLRSSVQYYDAQFDDARMLVEMVQKIWDKGGMAFNYVEAKTWDFFEERGLHKIKLKEKITGEEIDVHTKVIINAAGIFSPEILHNLTPPISSPIVMSKGVHIVVGKKFAENGNALLIPKTKDGRVLFVIPWQERVLIGTTDTAHYTADIEPLATKNDIQYLLDVCSSYLEKSPKEKDILSVFAGLRALVNSSTQNKRTKELSRKHQIQDHGNSFITVVGGKWTTFRKIGEDVLQYLCKSGQLIPTNTKHDLEESNAQNSEKPIDPFDMYGAKKSELYAFLETSADLKNKLHSNFPFIKGQVAWAVKHEFAIKLEDVLARRFRSLFLDVKSTIEMAPEVATIMADCLNETNDWIKTEMTEFETLSHIYSIEHLKD